MKNPPPLLSPLIPVLTAVLALVACPSPSSAQYRISVGQPLESKGGLETVFGRANIYVRAGSKSVHFEADPADVTELGSGWKVEGELGLRTGGGVLKMARAEVFFERSAQGGIERMRGLACMPPPYASGRIEIASPAMAEIGVDLGKSIDLGVPLNDETPYVFFRFKAGLSMSMGVSDEPGATKPLSLAVPGGVDGVYILDPSDPFYYVSGAFLGGGEDEETDSGNEEGGDAGDSRRDGVERNDQAGEEDEEETSGQGIGRSKNGRIPFVPRDVRGLEQFVKPFHGTHLRQGAIPIANLPLELRGTMITAFEKLGSDEDAIDLLGIGYGPTYHAGANGTLAVVFPFGEVAGSSLFEFGFDLGEGTLGVDVDRNHQRAWFRGVIDPDTSWIPQLLPIRQSGRVELMGHLSTDVRRSFFQADGFYEVSLGDFGGWMAGRFGGACKVAGHLRADESGLYLRGTTTARFEHMKMEAAAKVEARLASGNDYLRFGGTFLVSGNRIEGDFTVAEEMKLCGTLKARGLDLSLEGRMERHTSMRLKGELELDPRFEEKLHGALGDVAEEVEGEIARGMAELEQATKGYQFELSLRGIRPAIPEICRVAIEEIRSEVPKQINRQWPKKFGVSVPGRKTALKRAKKIYQPYIDRLAQLSRVAKKGDDAVLRGEIERAIRDVLKHDKLKVKVKVVGTIYEERILTKSQRSQLNQALAAIKALPVKSDQVVSARQAFDAIRKSDVLRELGARIRSGATQGLPRIEHIRFDMPVSLVGSGVFSVRLRVRTGMQVSEPAFQFDCEDPYRFVGELAQSWRYR